MVRGLGVALLALKVLVCMGILAPDRAMVLAQRWAVSRLRYRTNGGAWRRV